MTSTTIFLASDFSPSPAGRFIEDGPFSGSLFRDKFLLPAIAKNDKVVIDLDSTELPGSSFLEEAFGGLVRAGLTETTLKKKLELHSPRSTDPIRIWRYIHDEAVRSNRVS